MGQNWPHVLSYEKGRKVFQAKLYFGYHTTSVIAGIDQNRRVKNNLNCTIIMSYVSPFCIYYLCSSFASSPLSSKSGLSFSLCPLHLLVHLQFIPGHSPRAANGLLSPPLEDPVRASQSSLCDMLQEKEKKTSTSTGTGTSLGMAGGTGAAGTGMDHSALIQLRAKNFREKSDVHFVDVIREDRWVKC